MSVQDADPDLESAGELASANETPGQQEHGFVSRLLFAPVSAWPLAIARILLGLTLVAWAVSMMFDVNPLLISDGLASPELASSSWRPFALESEMGIWIALIVLTVAGLMITAGLKPAPLLVLSFLLMVSVQRRNPAVLNSGDLILRNLLFLLAFAPSSAALSTDRWWAHGRSALWTAPLVAPMGMRLMQLQMMVAYFIAFWSKSGVLWLEGTAVSTALRLEDLRRFTPPDLFTTNIPVTALMTWGTLALELALALFLWNRRMRPTLIVLGILLHLFIDMFMLVGFFGPAMFAGLLTFLDGDGVQERINKWFGRSDQLPTGSTAATV